MAFKPRKLPETGRYRALFQWLNSLVEYVESMRPVNNDQSLTTHTRGGVIKEFEGGNSSTTSVSQPPVWQ